MLIEQRWDVIPGAESAGVAARARRAARSSASSPPTPTSASSSFSHGGVIAEILAQVADTNRPFAFLGCDNASISQVVAFGGRWILRRFNDTAHLDVDDLDPADPDLPSSSVPSHAGRAGARS